MPTAPAVPLYIQSTPTDTAAKAPARSLWTGASRVRGGSLASADERGPDRGPGDHRASSGPHARRGQSQVWEETSAPVSRPSAAFSATSSAVST